MALCSNLRGGFMTVSYKKLWKLLIDKEMKKKDLQAQASISWASITKMSKGEKVSMEVLMKVCKALNCDIGDIMELNTRRSRKRDVRRKKCMAIDKKKSPYKASITREQFLFYEMRTTAKLLDEGLDDKEVVQRIIDENLFQYPTEKSVERMAKACIARLKNMNDEALISEIAKQPSDVSKQICLYAMMKESRLLWDFMITVIGNKYQKLDTSFGKIDLNSYIMQLQEQDDVVATWSDSTIAKIKQVLTKILVENEYLDNNKSTSLNPVWLNPVLENAIRDNNDDQALVAFNCIS